MLARTTALAASTSASGLSKTSSSWTWSNMRVPGAAAGRAAAIFSMASLHNSAALP